MKPGDAVKFNHPNGSTGRIESANHYGGFYVRWYYGQDARGDQITALSSVRPENLVKATEEELEAITSRRAWRTP